MEVVGEGDDIPIVTEHACACWHNHMCVGMVTVLPVFVSLQLFSLSAKHTCRSRHGAYACYGWCYRKEHRPAVHPLTLIDLCFRTAGVAARCFYFSNAAAAVFCCYFGCWSSCILGCCFFAFVCLYVWGWGLLVFLLLLLILSLLLCVCVCVCVC